MDTRGKVREHCFGDAGATQGVKFGMNPKFFTVEEANALTGFLENALEPASEKEQPQPIASTESDNGNK